MTLLDLVTRIGWPTLARLVALVMLFVLVHAARWPFVAVLWCLSALLRAIDHAVTTGLAASLPPTTPRWRTA